LFWLSDEQWQRIEPHLPTDVRGVERQDDRRIISGTRAEKWLPLVRLSRSLRASDDDLQSLRSVGAARHMGKPVPAARRQWSI
jgi:hypothetical protein